MATSGTATTWILQTTAERPEMHIQFLVEDASGATMLRGLMDKLIDTSSVTYDIKSYKGIGNVVPKAASPMQAKNKMLLNNLPRVLQGYGKSMQGIDFAVVVVMDLDRRDEKAFRDELAKMLATCQGAPATEFCLAIEEGEAWLLGDFNAIEKAYPRCKKSVLRQYRQDSICGTWEILADALLKGGSRDLIKGGYQNVGKAKCEWAARIPPYMDVDANRSPSFRLFRNTVSKLAGSTV